MSMNKLCEDLKAAIKKGHETDTSVSEAELLACKALDACLALADEIQSIDLKTRMRKAGVRTIRAQAYMDEIAKHDKKPAEGYLDAAIALQSAVQAAEQDLAEHEVELNRLKTYADVFAESHQYFRAIMKAGFGG